MAPSRRGGAGVRYLIVTGIIKHGEDMRYGGWLESTLGGAAGGGGEKLMVTKKPLRE